MHIILPILAYLPIISPNASAGILAEFKLPLAATKFAADYQSYAGNWVTG
jgi:hypothetical protein